MSHLIVNTAALQGRRRARLEDLAKRHLADLHIAPTERAGDVVRLAEEACRSGVQRLVVAGGDGTVHEAANGIRGYEIELAIVPGGSGNDYVKSIGIPRDFVRALEMAAGGVVRQLDAVEITCRGFDDSLLKRVFVNIAEAGIGGEVVRLAAGLRGIVGRRIGYHAGLAVGLLRTVPRKLRLVIDGTEVRTDCLNNLIVANGQYFGGGMHPVPEALLDDGLLNVVLIHDLGRVGLVRQSHLIQTGLPHDNPNIDHWQAREVIAESPDPVLVEADGELLGLLPATFRVLPRALRVVCS